MKIMPEKFDVIVIGGGPAGMIAAGTAAKAGARVALFEKNNRLGVKLLMTGHGRCNLTNDLSAQEFINKIGQKGKFLFSSMHAFDSRSTMKFLAERGLELKIENNNRVFPITDKAADVLKIFELELLETGVNLFLNYEVVKISKAEQIFLIELLNGKIYQAGSVVIAAGGKSYPATGSTGDGFAWAESFGHQIINPRPGLTAINLHGKVSKELEGLSLKDVSVKVFSGSKKVIAQGDLLFTGTGISGPLAHDLSLGIEEEVKGLKLVIDLYKEADEDELNKQLQTIFHQEGGRQIKNGLLNFLEPRLIPVVLKQAGVDEFKIQNSILREERKQIVEKIKKFEFKIESLAGFERANVTVGGVDLSEVDPKTLQSKLIDNLYFTGEVLDLAGPTGGFNLQIAWTTGFVAGKNSAN